jgi:hypothetical protein
MSEKYQTAVLKAAGRSVTINRWQKEPYTVTDDQKKAAAERRNYGKRRRAKVSAE